MMEGSSGSSHGKLSPEAQEDTRTQHQDKDTAPVPGQDTTTGQEDTTRTQHVERKTFLLYPCETRESRGSD